MSIQEGVLKYSELINRPILDLRTTEELGRVDNLSTVEDAHRVAGIIYKSGFLGGQKKTLLLSQIRAIGPDALMVNTDGETDEQIKSGESLVGHEVWTDGGSRIGKITDFLFDGQTGVISHYLFAASGWSGITDGTYLLEASAITTPGKKRVIVNEAVAKSSTLYSEGLKQRLGTALEQAKERSQSLTDQLKERTAALGEQAKGLVDQAKERGQVLGEQAKERAAALGEQARELADQAIERGQSLVESTQERLHPPTTDVEATVVEEPQPLPPAEPVDSSVTPSEPLEPQPKDPHTPH
ncbi:PRC-barrel domain-containing protein [Gloeobacter violaceus]|uniref:Gll0541 protein n=1 Tax=Gloeobacter violaceus (strain ATCC 29082 / PCC 7421) TaxID=251221 RepID=Q7NN72_GLOVI|nr:PRC-barrel domain-containing protein [Gloeobacter violaceus]BAC88482.1 gll0541 [Gloeobacter violaceus PCC 7421]